MEHRQVRTVVRHEAGDDVDGEEHDMSGAVMEGMPTSIHDLPAVIVIKLEEGRRTTATELYLGQPLEQAGKPIDLLFRPESCIIVPAES